MSKKRAFFTHKPKPRLKARPKEPPTLPTLARRTCDRCLAESRTRVMHCRVCGTPYGE